MSDETQTISRRGALKAVAGSGAAVLTLGLLDASSASATPTAGVAGAKTVVGKVAGTSQKTLKLAPSSGASQILLTEQARAYSGAFGHVSSARDFIVGDQVAAEGVERGDVLEATSVGSIFRNIEVHVRSLSRDGSIAYTDHGAVDLRHGHLPDEVAAHRNRLQQFVGSIRPGDVIAGSGWTDPRDGRRYLLIPQTT